MGKHAPNPTIRILMLGSVGVGKNCLESRFTTMTYPPPYDPALTLNSRRYFTLSPIHAVGDCAPADAGARAAEDRQQVPEDDGGTKKGAVMVSAVERPGTSSSTSSNQAVAAGVAADPEPVGGAGGGGDTYSLDDRTLVGSDICSECARENNTYLVEVINYPTLQLAKVRSQVHAKADYDAVLLVYDVADRASFDAVTALHAEIPVCTRKNHHHHHRKAAPHASATRSRTSGWFGGGGNETGTTGSGEIVVGLVGNKSDCDRAGRGGEYINGSGESDDGMSPAAEARSQLPPPLDHRDAALQEADVVERSLLHPLYRESILYEELMAGLADQEKQPAHATNRSLTKKAARGDDAPTPTTPFPTGEPPLSPAAQLRMEASKNDDIQKWLQMGKLDNKPPGDSDADILPGASGKEPGGGDEIMTAAAAEAPWPLETGIASSSRHSEPKRTAPSTSPKRAAPPKPLRRQVAPADGEALAQALQLPVPFFETSARTGRHVEMAFENLVREVLREMGRDASGTNKAGKTCRHRVGGGVVAAAPQHQHQHQQKQRHEHAGHNHRTQDVPAAAPVAAASPKGKTVVSVVSAGKDGGDGGATGHEKDIAVHEIRVVQDTVIQRPDSAALFKDAKKAGLDDAGVQHHAEEHALVDDGADGVLAVPRQAHSRESVMGRMRKMFARKPQQVVMV